MDLSGPPDPSQLRASAILVAHEMLRWARGEDEPPEDRHAIGAIRIAGLIAFADALRIVLTPDALRDAEALAGVMSSAIVEEARRTWRGSGARA